MFTLSQMKARSMVTSLRGAECTYHVYSIPFANVDLNILSLDPVSGLRDRTEIYNIPSLSSLFFFWHKHY